jgi:hypothetical protein
MAAFSRAMTTDDDLCGGLMMSINGENRGWRRVDSETLVLNPQKAKEFAVKHNGLPHSPCERTLMEERVEQLHDLIVAGRAIPFNWAIVKYEGIDYRMNGQHSSKAIMDFDALLPQSLVFHVDRYEADNRDAFANLFRQFDARWSARSKGDVAGAFQGLNHDVADCDRAKAKLAVEGVSWYRRMIEKVPVPNGDDLYTLFFESPLSPFIRWIDDTLTLKTPEMKVAAVIACMYATFCKSESGARDFWRQIAVNSNSDDMAPAAVLSAELISAKQEKNPKNKLKPGILFGKCVKAWNAFRHDEKIRSLPFTLSKGLPELAS